MIDHTNIAPKSLQFRIDAALKTFLELMKQNKLGAGMLPLAMYEKCNEIVKKETGLPLDMQPWGLPLNVQTLAARSF